MLNDAFSMVLTPTFPPTETFGAAKFRLIDGGIEICGASIFRLGAAMLTFESHKLAPVPMFPPIETFGAATLRLIDGIATFNSGACTDKLGAAMLTDADPLDAPMPMFPPIETFGAATLRLIDGIPIETFGTPILTSVAFIDNEGASILTLGISTLRLGA